MDFFAEQDLARKRSGRLVLLFAVAVVLIIAIIYVVAMVAYSYVEHEFERGMIWWHPGVFAATAGLTVVVILLGSLGRVASLGAGGTAVAEMVGGRLISPDSADPDERKVLNVVEEMALASGTPVPPVYLLDESGINAFAAGYRSDSAVIGVTRGCIQRLSRDELQGVVAHEFSHILHGDMRLNIRLMGVLYGILMLSVIGSIMMRVIWLSGGRRRSSSDKGNGQGVIFAIAAAGLVMYIVGYVGVIFGNLIKAAVSRQREYLADASAVQYTRNPDGIGGALKKIGGFHTRIDNSGAGEASHFFFGPVSNFSNMLSTHPPLAERIRRIDPQFAAERQQQSSSAAAGGSAAGGRAAGFAGSATADAGPAPAAPASATSAAAVSAGGSSREALLRSIGDPSDAHMAHSRQVLASLSESLRKACHDPFSARAIIYCLLLDHDQDLAAQQWRAMEQHADAQVVAEAARLRDQVVALPRPLLLSVVEMCLPALGQLTKEQRQRFLAVVERLIQADDQVTAFEYGLRHQLHRALDPRFAAEVRGKASAADVRCLLLVVAAQGNPDDDQAATAAYLAAAQEAGFSAQAADFSHAASHDWQAFDAALLRLGKAKPSSKRTLLRAVIAAASHDGQLTAAEGDLVRVIASGLDCPVPPILSTVEAS